MNNQLEHSKVALAETAKHSPQSESAIDRSNWEGMTVFHEGWWLDAVAPGAWRYLKSHINDKEVGILPIWENRRFGLAWNILPPFTHVLGAAVDLGEGNETSKSYRRFKITSELLAQVPAHGFFRQVADVNVGDMLAYQAKGFAVAPHYTILVDCNNPETVWNGFRQNTRRFIRKAQSSFEVKKSDDIDAFVDFYIRNLDGKKLSERTDMRLFPAIYRASRAVDAGQIFVATNKKGEWAAAVFAVWGHGKMFYLLTTRDKSNPDYGVVSLIVWELVKEAQQRGLKLDLDGIISESIALFLTGFGGSIVPRMVFHRTPLFLQSARLVQRLLRRRGPEPTFI